MSIGEDEDGDEDGFKRICDGSGDVDSDGGDGGADGHDDVGGVRDGETIDGKRWRVAAMVTLTIGARGVPKMINFTSARVTLT